MSQDDIASLYITGRMTAQTTSAILSVVKDYLRRVKKMSSILERFKQGIKKFTNNSVVPESLANVRDNTEIVIDSKFLDESAGKFGSLQMAQFIV